MLVSDKTIDTHKQLLAVRQDYAAKNYMGRYSAYDENNPFGKILKGEAETELVDETPYAITIKNANQRTETYHLVLPVYPASDVIDLLRHAPDEHKAGYFEAIKKAVREIHPRHQTRTNIMNGSCARVLFNVGPYSQNTVQYCHAHVTGDDNPLSASFLLMSEKGFDNYDESVRSIVSAGKTVHGSLEKPLAPDLEPGFTIGEPDSGVVCHFNNGFKYGVKKTGSYLADASREENLTNIYKLVSFLTAWTQMSMCSQNAAGNWGGRFIVDTDEKGDSLVVAVSGAKLKKLPQTPLTIGQQKDYLNNLIRTATLNER